MNVELKSDAVKMKKNDVVSYSILIDSDTTISNAKIEIIPTAEKYPDTNILPNTASVTVSNGLTYTAGISDTGIFEINIPQTNLCSSFTVSYSAKVINNFNKSTTAVIVTSDNNGSTYEAYAQTTVSGYSSPAIIPAACFLVLASSILIKLAIKRII